MEIRYLADDPEETSLLASWIYHEWGHLVPGRTLDTARRKVRQTAGAAEIPLTLVCFLDGEMVGAASLDTVDMSTHQELAPWLASVYVVPRMRRRGIATALCRRARQELERSGVKTAYLFTPDAQALYQKLGWKTFLREEYRGELVSIMRLYLG